MIDPGPRSGPDYFRRTARPRAVTTSGAVNGAGPHPPEITKTVAHESGCALNGRVGGQAGVGAWQGS